jgi:hypothetical protein
MDQPKYLGCGTFGKPVVNTTKVLESVLILAPTTLEMGLTPLELLHLGPGDSLQQHISDLVAVRDATDRYSSIQIVSSVELNVLLDTFAQSGKAYNVVIKLRELLDSENSQTIYLWNEGCHSIQ